ncbi:DUF6777 domain-containing protein [Streptomyces sp. NPDC002685]|uniref:DUF6777 domain-containing protein n=1 Tax=Streptomyces sp. NPDC002685 TaxID=3154540 RepID=UPI00332F9F2B
MVHGWPGTARDGRENVVHIPTRTLVAACALAAALLVVAGCGGSGRDRATSGSNGGEVFLQPVAAQGPDPFTASTDTSTVPRPPVTRTPQSSPTGTQSVRSLSGATPGLYGGTRNVGSCDVEKQIRFLGADRVRADAFAQASGISPGSVPVYLRGLTPVELSADTRVTNHGFGNGRARGFQAVLQVGTAVLIDNRGVPRVRCACGNPLGRPTALDGNPGTRGRPWSGYRPEQVVVVTPAPVVITDITIIDVADNTWIERPIGHDGHHHDHVVPPPDGWAPSPRPHDSSPHPHAPSSSDPPGDRSPSPDTSASDCVSATTTATATVTATPEPGEKAPGETGGPGTGPTGRPTDGAARDVSRPDRPAPPRDEPSHCPTATVTAPPTTRPGTTPAPSGGNTAPRTAQPDPDRSGSPEPTSQRVPPTEPGTPTEDAGPDTVPDSPDVPDGGLIPEETTGSDSVFDASADNFDR